MGAAPSVFLAAESRSLVMVNYAIDPEVLAPHLPRGIELDLWQGEALLSMVGCLFLKRVYSAYRSRFIRISKRLICASTSAAARASRCRVCSPAQRPATQFLRRQRLARASAPGCARLLTSQSHSPRMKFPDAQIMGLD